ncbi:unnamed protein product, partial [Pylaiella littoralis]
LPAGWAEEYGADGSWKFKTSKGGTPVSVSVTRPGPGGGCLVKNITFHQVNVSDIFQDLRKTITTTEELGE